MGHHNYKIISSRCPGGRAVCTCVSNLGGNNIKLLVNPVSVVVTQHITPCHLNIVPLIPLTAWGAVAPRRKRQSGMMDP